MTLPETAYRAGAALAIRTLDYWKYGPLLQMAPLGQQGIAKWRTTMRDQIRPSLQPGGSLNCMGHL